MLKLKRRMRECLVACLKYIRAINLKSKWYRPKIYRKRITIISRPWDCKLKPAPSSVHLKVKIDLIRLLVAPEPHFPKRPRNSTKKETNKCKLCLIKVNSWQLLLKVETNINKASISRTTMKTMIVLLYQKIMIFHKFQEINLAQTLIAVSKVYPTIMVRRSQR